MDILVVLNTGLPEKISMKTFVALFLSTIACSTLSAQSLNPNWEKEITASLEQYLACSASAETSKCGGVQGESLNTVYKINDFFSAKTGRHMTVNEVTGFLKQATTWTPLGPAYSQSTLTEAQQLANEKKAVVAVYQNAASVGHIALILPGALEPSGSWGLNVPKTASFFLPEPSRSFVNKGLSFAFTKSMLKDVTIYVRNY